MNKILALPHIQKFAQIFAHEIENFRIVGGAVRDDLLKQQIKDIDISTKFTVEELIELCLEKQLKFKPTGLKYGTITLFLAGEIIEITSLRSDIKTDGRHCEIAYASDFAQDAKRRDFTINALYMDFKGKIYDYFDGRADLKQKKLIFIGDVDARISEDYLRILRLFRFKANLAGFSISATTLIKCAHHKDKLCKLSAERILSELTKLLNGANYADSLALMSEYQICDFVFNYNNLDKIKYFNEVNAENSNINVFLYNLSSDKPLGNLVKTLKISKTQYKEILFLENHHKQYNSFAPTELTKIIFLHGRDNCKNLYLNYILQNSLRADKIILANIANIEIPVFSVTGHDLQNRGYNKGKILGAKLLELKNRWLDSDFTLSKTQLLHLIEN